MKKMKKAILGTKLGMTQIFAEDGKVIPVTVIEAGPNAVIQKKTVENDGYAAVQLGFGEVSLKHVNKPMKGHFAKGETAAKKYLKEFKLDNAADLEVGAELKADMFAEGEFLDVTGTTKGRGYAGVMVRHHFKGGRDGHGGGWHRKPGSIGCRECPGNIMKGKPMPGQLGQQGTGNARAHSL